MSGLNVQVSVSELPASLRSALASVSYGRADIKLSLRGLMASLREGPFTSVGSYPKYWITADGGTLSYEAIMAEIWQVARVVRDHANAPDERQWRVIAVGVNWEDAELRCDHTGKRIPSAYAEPEAANA